MVRDDRRLLIFTFSFSVLITNEHFLAPGVLEEMVTFQCSAQNIDLLLLPQVDGSERDMMSLLIIWLSETFLED